MSAREVTCIIGWPVSYSLSPTIHAEAFESLALDWIYIPIGVRPQAIDEGMKLMRTLDVAGANVTMPHKRAVAPFMSSLEGDAAVLEVVNTLVRTDRGFVGHNTDGAGFVQFLREDVGWTPTGARALVLGGGGAARAVAYALAREGAKVLVAARRPDQAADIARLHENIEPAAWGERVEADLFVNATAAREGLPLEALSLRPGSLAVDLIYAPPETAFLRAARAGGATGLDGLGMLIHQAALSFRLWTGLDAPVEVMAAAARRALAGRAA